ncbi:hydrolase CocE/NonD family protein [Dactylonectria macrodidyma]|uniref:Hydrolase CocE/NonD family protein n=1 Tax=Dactylonectria macrodidyma TaxID=307937 RepID=A0A9P9FRZ1_9HYPO|nr:hydrolase CocE/NonD family protein [Dactylonectria macrodidyma]
MRRLLPTDAPRARYPGFKPETLVLKAGTIRREGAKELPCDIIFERDVPVTLRDGTIIYTDVFRPVGDAAVPAIVAWSPYGKEVGGQWLDDIAGRSGVPLSRVSELQKFEGPDPAYWVNQGYAVLNPDARGAYASEGNLTLWGRQLAEDGYDFVEWAAAQTWSSGKIGMSGNSWLAVSQWFIAAEKPPHLSAIAPWEGLSDVYRDSALAGGIPAPGFMEGILTTFSGDNFAEDVPRMMVNQSLINEYWKDKAARLSEISVPAYVVASYTNTAHTHGTFAGFRQMRSTKKWLRVHNSYEWPDYYQPENVAELTKFFDRYLKGERNGWESTPRVRISVLDPGGEDTINRVVSDWPVPGLTTKKLYLHADGKLGHDEGRKEKSISYDVQRQSDGITLNYTISQVLEINGYMKVRLWVSAIGSSDLDLVVKVEKRSANGSVIATASSMEQESTIAARGTLRVSHRALDRKRSTAFEPYHPHNCEELLHKGQIVPVEIGLWPMALRFHPGERLALTISPATISSPQTDLGFGTAIVPVPENGGTFVNGTKVSLLEMGGPPDSDPEFVNAQRIAAPKSRNNGTHVIHVGGKYDSFLLMPVDLETHSDV